MGTRPQTLGYSLLDSPPGLVALLGEKYADDRPGYGSGVSSAEHVDTIALYWRGATSRTSAASDRRAGVRKPRFTDFPKAGGHHGRCGLTGTISAIFGAAPPGDQSSRTLPLTLPPAGSSV